MYQHHQVGAAVECHQPDDTSKLHALVFEALCHLYCETSNSKPRFLVEVIWLSADVLVLAAYAVLTDGYLQTIGPRPDGSWGSVPFSMFTRLCQLVIQSNKDADFSWSAGRALMR